MNLHTVSGMATSAVLSRKGSYGALSVYTSKVTRCVIQKLIICEGLKLLNISQAQDKKHDFLWICHSLHQSKAFTGSVDIQDSIHKNKARATKASLLLNLAQFTFNFCLQKNYLSKDCKTNPTTGNVICVCQGSRSKVGWEKFVLGESTQGYELEK